MVTLTTYENDGSEHLRNDGSKRLWKWWLSTTMIMVDLNAYENYGSERLWKWWWLWTPLKMVALNTNENGSSNTYENGGIVALNACEMMSLNAYENGGSKRLRKWWLWTLMKMMGLWTHMKTMALNTYENGGSECLWKWWIWMPKKMMVALNTYENSGS